MEAVSREEIVKDKNEGITTAERFSFPSLQMAGMDNVAATLSLEVLLDIRDQQGKIIDLLQNPPVEISAAPKFFENDAGLIDIEEPEKDALFDEAVEIVRGKKRATAHLLHDHLHIPIYRALDIIDQLEAAGIISAKGKGGRRTVV